MKAQVIGIKINTDIVTGTRKRFDEMLSDLEVDDEVPPHAAEELEARCMVIAAPSGAGKSHILLRLREHPSLQPYRDEIGPVRPLIAVKAPSPCTLKTLGIQICHRLTGMRLRASATEHEIWTEVRAQLDAQHVSVLMIDEFHHAFAKSSADQRRNLVETLKNLAIPDPADPLRQPGSEMRPIMLVLSGMPWTIQVLNQDSQLLRRRAVIAIEPLKNDQSGLRKAAKFMELVESKLPFETSSDLSEPDMLRRMMLASNGFTGRMMALVKQAAFLAINQKAQFIDRERHLAVVFEEIFQIGKLRNPFLVPDITSCPRVPEPAFERLTLLKGTGDE
ncbi:TniB family NTP-binding protein [Bosea sp. ANAM02]|uniref:TniB family NTP-binding protein n=1 Tax=Bosea sp. ANAM02 TaxID=2020412 RepID=UPI00140F4BF7|nr:TniB family NTP-binding protein [Bosea sp. ANAM02]BCB17124.1 hypothetical protein OCUBac02_00180 [Bosea sp. ANAM02]